NQGMGGGLTGAGVGLGVGQSLGAALNPEQAALQQQMQQQQLMMQQMMMQMMQQHNGNVNPANVPAEPQTAEQVKALLDKLDMKLASGEISEDLYKKMSEKWEARLKELGG